MISEILLGIADVAHGDSTIWGTEKVLENSIRDVWRSRLNMHEYGKNSEGLSVT